MIYAGLLLAWIGVSLIHVNLKLTAFVLVMSGVALYIGGLRRYE